MMRALPDLLCLCWPTRAWRTELEQDGFTRMPTCSTRGSHPRSGRCPRWAGLTRNRPRGDGPRRLSFACCRRSTRVRRCARRGEIITLWVSRMVMFNRYSWANGQGNGAAAVPPDVFVHCVVQDGEGRKMSKSLGTGWTRWTSSLRTDRMRCGSRCATCPRTRRMCGCRCGRTRRRGGKHLRQVRHGAELCEQGLERGELCVADAGRERGGEIPPTPHQPSPPGGRGVCRIGGCCRAGLASAVSEVVEGALKNFEFSSYAQTMYDFCGGTSATGTWRAIKPTRRGGCGQRAVARGDAGPRS